MKNTQEQFREERSPVFEKYGAMLYRICLSVLHDNYYAEDAVSDTFLRYYTSARRFKSDEHERAWLIRAARHASIDILRRRKRNSYSPIESIPEEMLAEYDDLVRASALFSALFSLPEIYSTSIWMYYGEGMDSQAIAKALNLSPSAVRKRLSRGRELLKQKYEETEGNTK